ncbi:MAG: hypothetical protein OXU61_10940 [Gammaproteobacteria bacterium]|nr:hypothetical protein [Gammaproteobacteria bacterium]
MPFASRPLLRRDSRAFPHRRVSCRPLGCTATVQLRPVSCLFLARLRGTVPGSDARVRLFGRRHPERGYSGSPRLVVSGGRAMAK